MDYVPAIHLYNYVMEDSRFYFRYLQLSQLIKRTPQYAQSIVFAAYDIASDAAMVAISDKHFDEQYNTTDNICKAASFIIQNAERRAGVKLQR